MTLRHALHSVGISTLAILFAGCPKNNVHPSPDDTVMASGQPTDREDWINETDASLADGLVPRDASPFNGVNPQTVYTSIFFEFDNFSLSPAEREHLVSAADHLNKNPSSMILLEGHCDWFGTVEYNLTLGDKRAVTVKDYLVGIGISPNRIETLSKGSLDSTANLGKAEAAKDRRVDLILLK